MSFYDRKYIKERTNFVLEMTGLCFPRWSGIRYLCLDIRRLIPARYRLEIHTGNWNIGVVKSPIKWNSREWCLVVTISGSLGGFDSANWCFNCYLILSGLFSSMFCDFFFLPSSGFYDFILWIFLFWNLTCGNSSRPKTKADSPERIRICFSQGWVGNITILGLP